MITNVKLKLSGTEAAEECPTLFVLTCCMTFYKRGAACLGGNREHASWSRQG